jgi:hypothetical protein
VELHWVRRPANVLENKITNEGVDKDGLELDNTWFSIPGGKLRKDCNHLAEKDHEGRLSMEGHIKEDIARPHGRYVGPR